jgi:hypothetical protein
VALVYTVSFTPYFPDEAPILHVQSLSHCDEDSKPIELLYSHFLAVGASPPPAGPLLASQTT